MWSVVIISGKYVSLVETNARATLQIVQPRKMCNHQPQPCPVLLLEPSGVIVLLDEWAKGLPEAEKNGVEAGGVVW